VPVRARFAFSGRRLDAQYFCAPGVRAAEALVLLQAANVEVASVAQLGSVFHPYRFKRQLAAPAEESVPFLRAFDVFEYLPQPADQLSVPRTSKFDSLVVEPGTILLTRSGRNLGPAVMVDDYLRRFVPSDDLLRIRIADSELRYYVLAFLNSSVGQALLRQDKTGSVIDHLSAAQVEQQGIPLLDDVVESVTKSMRRCLELRSAARVKLAEAVDRLNEATVMSPTPPLRDGWTTQAATVSSRFDAAYHQPRVGKVREQLLDAGGVVLGDAAVIRKPAGRYRTYYVGPEHGKPLLSGRNLLQVTPIAPKYISPRSIPDGCGYELQAGWFASKLTGGRKSTSASR
jgi:hypothetical protein